MQKIGSNVEYESLFETTRNSERKRYVYIGCKLGFLGRSFNFSVVVPQTSLRKSIWFKS